MMNTLKILFLSLFISNEICAQELPQQYSVAPVSPDVNQQFAILHFEPIAKDKFSIVYLQNINASVVTGNEVMRDTGSVVYTNDQKKEMVQFSNSATLLVKQLVEANGRASTQQVWVLANRKMESAGEYRLFLPRGFKHPIINTNIPLQHTMHNLDNVKGLSRSEFEALVLHAKQMFPERVIAQNQVYKEPTLADDINKTKEQFRSLRASGLTGRGDLPKEESVLTRFTMKADQSFVVTKSGKKSTLLKFYLTEDFKTFDLIDTASVEGKIDLTSVATVYDTNATVVGAVTNLLNRTKDDKGADLSQQITYGLFPDFKIYGWKHLVGKNKLNSLNPEICWFEGDKLLVLSTNNEKFFKPYYQLHQFEKNKEALLLFPKTADEQGTEKSVFAESFQPQQPVGSAPPLAQRNIALGFKEVGGTRYIFTEGVRKDEATNTDQYLPLNILRIEADGKVTTLDMLPGYKAQVPVSIVTLGEYEDRSYYMVNYPNILQVALNREKSAVTPIVPPTEMLVSKLNGDKVVKNEFGTLLLKRSAAGTAYTLSFYPMKL